MEGTRGGMERVGVGGQEGGRDGGREKGGREQGVVGEGGNKGKEGRREGGREGARGSREEALMLGRQRASVDAWRVDGRRLMKGMSEEGTGRGMNGGREEASGGGVE